MRNPSHSIPAQLFAQTPQAAHDVYRSFHHQAASANERHEKITESQVGAWPGSPFPTLLQSIPTPTSQKVRHIVHSLAPPWSK